jgi:hypothetical protein
MKPSMFFVSIDVIDLLSLFVYPIIVYQIACWCWGAITAPSNSLFIHSFIYSLFNFPMTSLAVNPIPWWRWIPLLFLLAPSMSITQSSADATPVVRETLYHVYASLPRVFDDSTSDGDAITTQSSSSSHSTTAPSKKRATMHFEGGDMAEVHGARSLYYRDGDRLVAPSPPSRPHWY